MRTSMMATLGDCGSKALSLGMSTSKMHLGKQQPYTQPVVDSVPVAMEAAHIFQQVPQWDARLGTKSGFQYLRDTGSVMGKDFNQSKSMRVGYENSLLPTSYGRQGKGFISGLRNGGTAGLGMSTSKMSLGAIISPAGWANLSPQEQGAITAMSSSYGGDFQTMLNQVTSDYLAGDPATVSQIKTWMTTSTSSISVATPGDTVMGIPTNLVYGVAAALVAYALYENYR